MAAKKEIFCHTFLQKQGKCQCPGYVESTSKWSKGKCKRCTHPKSMHTGFMEEENEKVEVQKEEQPKQEQPKQQIDNDAKNDCNDADNNDVNEPEQEQEE